MLKILLFLSLTSIVYSENNPCIGGRECTCICTKHKNPYYQELVKQGVKFPKLICGCPEGGCGSSNEKVPELKFKKETNRIATRMLP